MAKRNYLLVDAFTTQPLEGNPCAVFFESDDLAEAQMLAIAREMNLSECAFVMKARAGGNLGARYFTPREEIPFAGHPTVALIHAAREVGILGSAPKIKLELKAGTIDVELLEAPGGPRKVRLYSRPAQFLKSFTAEEVLPLFGLNAGDVLTGARPQIVSTGNPGLLVPIKSLATLRHAELQVSAYRAFKERENFFSPHLFCLQGATAQGDTFARHFGLPPDTAEDPFTGSASASMGAYLWHYGLIKKPNFVAEQGHWMQRPGQAQIEVIGPPEEITAVSVTGSAVTVARGEIFI